MTEAVVPPINPTPQFPSAVVVQTRQLRSFTWLWVVTLFCVALAFGLSISSLRAHGPSIRITFRDGHGIKAGDLLRYRGIAAGEVTDIALTRDSKHVAVTVRLEPSTSHLAKRSSQFWIERPRISLSRVSGLETVVGPKFLGVIPGSDDDPVVSEFEGRESPPTLTEPDFAEITIRFSDGHGLQIGDSLRHRGIVIGEVTSVDLNHELSSVVVKARLVGEAHHLAREGSQFWIERPRLSVAEVRGLDTLVGGRFIAVTPGLDDAKEAHNFEGIEVAPVVELPTGALEIVLHAPQRWGIDRGVPITFRGLRVGQILSVGLSSDGTSLEARAFVEARYRSLVRQNSVFWSTSGVDLNLGLRGLHLNADSLATIAQGGVAFATPEPPGAQAHTGQRFGFERSPHEEWLAWRPRIAPGDTSRSATILFPSMQRAVVRWEERSFGFRRSRERAAWLIPWNNGTLSGPLDVLQPTESALGPVLLEVAGSQLTLQADQIQTSDGVGRVKLLAALKEVSGWTTNQTRIASEPEDVLLIADPQSEPQPLAASSVTVTDGKWFVRSTAGLGPAWHGAAVIAQKDGRLIGTLTCSTGSPSIEPWKTSAKTK